MTLLIGYINAYDIGVIHVKYERHNSFQFLIWDCRKKIWPHRRGFLMMWGPENLKKIYLESEMSCASVTCAFDCTHDYYHLENLEHRSSSAARDRNFHHLIRCHFAEKISQQKKKKIITTQSIKEQIINHFITLEYFQVLQSGKMLGQSNHTLLR